MNIDKIVAGIQLSNSLSVNQENPMGWIRPYFGNWARIVDEWYERLSYYQSGLHIRNVHGSCKPRLVDDKGHYAWFAGADMLSYEEHRRSVPFLRGLNESTRFIGSTGFPADDERLAANRIVECGFKEMSIDSSAEVNTPVTNSFIQRLLDKGIIIYSEPLCSAETVSPQFANTPALILYSQYLAIKRLDINLTIPTGSMIIVNGNNTPEEAKAALTNPDCLNVILAKKYLPPVQISEPSGIGDWEELPTMRFTSIPDQTKLR